MATIITGPDTKHSMFVVPCSYDPATHILTTLDGSTPGAGLSTLDAGPSWTPVRGVNADGEPFESADASGAAVACTLAPASGKKLVITDLVISVDTAMKVSFTEETSGKKVLTLYMPANSGAQQSTLRGPITLNTADKKLFVQTSAAGNISIQSSCYSA